MKNTAEIYKVTDIDPYPYDNGKPFVQHYYAIKDNAGRLIPGEISQDFGKGVCEYRFHKSWANFGNGNNCRTIILDQDNLNKAKPITVKPMEE